MSNPEPRLLRLVVAGIGGVAFVAVAVFCGVGVNGADPYWYAGDLAMLSLTGQARTNVIFPSTLLDPTISAGNLPMWLHNIPYTHAVSWLRPGAGHEYFAFLAANIALALLTALVVYLIATGAGMARPLAPALLFLAFPLTMLFTVNTYAEMVLAFGVAITVLGAQMTTTKSAPLAGLIICGAGVLFLFYNRQSFVLAILAFFIFCLYSHRSDREAVPLRLALPVVAVVSAATAIKGLLVIEYPTAGLTTLLMSSTTQLPSNMGSYDSTAPTSFALGPFLDKIGFGLYRAALPNEGFEFIIETPILFFVAFGLWRLRHDTATQALRHWSIVFILIYFVTLGVFQPAWRYLYSVVPIACVFAGLLWEQSRRPDADSRRNRVVRGVGLLTVTLFVAGSLTIALGYRSVGMKTNRQIDSMTTALAPTGDKPIMVVADRTQMMPLTYVVVPRPLLSAERGSNSTGEASRLIARWKPEVFVAGSKADLAFLEAALVKAYGSNAQLIHLAVLDTPGGDAHLLELER